MTAWLMALAGPASAKTLGLVVGIDDYINFKSLAETAPGNFPDLEGAANDAKVIAAAMKQAGVELPDSRILLDQKATLQAFLDGWKSVTTEAKPGDTVIVTFAGHGGQEKEVAPPFDEADGKDETIMFSDFDPKNPRKGRLNDDQLQEMLQAIKGFKVVLVMDSCHSAGLERAVNPKMRGVSRSGGTWDIPLDSLPDEPPSGEGDGAGKPAPNAVQLLATATEDLLVQEAVINGEPHGALSWYFAQALKGDADTNGDGVLSEQELASYVEDRVFTEMEQNQLPRILPVPDATPLIPIGKAKTAQEKKVPVVAEKVQTPEPKPAPSSEPAKPVEPAKQQEVAKAETPIVAEPVQPVTAPEPLEAKAEVQPVQPQTKIEVMPIQPQVQAQPQPVEPPKIEKLAAPTPDPDLIAVKLIGSPPPGLDKGDCPKCRFSQDAASLTFEAKNDHWDVYSGLGDYVGAITGDAAAQVSRIRFLRDLNAGKTADVPPATIKAMQSVARHKVGTSVSFDFAPPDEKTRFLTLFNLASDGTVQYGIEPRDFRPDEPVQSSVELRFAVSPPTGEDQLVAIWCKRPPTGLRAMLDEGNGKTVPPFADITGAVADNHCQYGRIGLFTEP